MYRRVSRFRVSKIKGARPPLVKAVFKDCRMNKTEKRNYAKWSALKTQMFVIRVCVCVDEYECGNRKQKVASQCTQNLDYSNREQ